IWRPSLYAFGSAEDSHGLPRVGLGRVPAEPNTALSLAAGIDPAKQWNGAGFDGTLFGVARSTFRSADRLYFGAAPAHAYPELNPSWRLTLDDAAKLQRQGHASPPDFGWNHPALS